jgi:hypothetical protein
MNLIWRKRIALTAMAALVASMGMGAAAAGAEAGKGKGKSEAKVEAKAKVEAEQESSVTGDVYGGNQGSKGKGKGKTHGLENALLKLEGKLAKEVILGILANRTVGDAEELAVQLEAEGEVEAAVVAQEEAVALSPADVKLVKKLAKLLVKAGKKEIKAFVNGKQPQFDVAPFVKEGRTLVPFRAIAASLQADVSYDSATQTVTVVRGEVTVTLTLGSDTAYVNGAPVKLDVAAESVQGRTVIPLRFLSEAFGAEVEFDAETQSVIITETAEAEATVETDADTTATQ